MEAIKIQLEKWKHVIAFMAFGGCVSLFTFGITSWMYRDLMQQQAEANMGQRDANQAHIKLLTEQLAIERGETRQQLAAAMHQLLNVGSQLSTVGAQVQSIADMATRISSEAAETARKAAGTAKSAAASARKAVQELKTLPGIEPPQPPAPRKRRRAPQEHIEP